MLKAPDLLDLFADARKDAKAKAPQARIATDGKGASAGRKGASNLLPIESPVKDPLKAPLKGKGDASTSSSFHSKVQESRDRLAAKAQKPAGPKHQTMHQKDAGPGQASDKASERSNARIRSESAGADRTDRASKAGDADRAEGQRSDRADRSGRAEQSDREARGEASRQMARDSMKTSEDGKAAIQSGEGQSAGSASRPADSKDAAGCAPQGDAPEVSDAELKDSLEALGIYASDEQLQDPNVLADILAMIQTLTMQQALPLDEAMAETEMPAVETFPAAGMADAKESEAGETTDPVPLEIEASPETASKTPKTDSRPAAEIKAAGLVQDRIAELNRNPAEAQTEIQRAAATPATTPAGWEGVKVRRQVESVTTSPLPMADLDRLRVMQASALQAVGGAKESEISTVELPGDDGAADPASEIGRYENVNREGDAAGGNAERDQADLFGRNGDRTGNAGNAASKENPLAAKDGATGPIFHNSLEQARSVEHRSGVERAWEPRHAMQPGVMDQIAKKMSAGGLKNGDEMSIQLSPEHLGKVRVSLEMKDGAMAARISVENDSVRQQVEAGLAVLRDSLENQGIKLQGLEVSVDQRQSSLFNPDGSNSESFFHRNGRGSQGAGSAAEASSLEIAPESDTGRRLGYNTMEYIG
jgi:flagellar hook-length control protein FliK